MLRKPLFLALLLAGCSKGPEADLPYIGQARSLAAEWAVVNEQSAAGHLNRTYADTMRKELRQQIKTASRSLSTPDSRHGEEIQALLVEPDDAAPEELRAYADRLKQIEDALESA